MKPHCTWLENNNGWVNRDLIGFYERYVRTVFNRYKNKVKYWLTFNEINSVLHVPFMSGGIATPVEKLSKQDLYQAVHHELVASALATKLDMKSIQNLKLDAWFWLCQHILLTPKPEDVLAAREFENQNYLFQIFMLAVNILNIFKDSLKKMISISNLNQGIRSY